MGQKQLQRWHVMKMAEVGKITLKEAGEKLGVSYRQAKRIRRAIRDKGIKGLIHGNRGRPSHRRLSEEVRQRVLALAKGRYGEFNDTHLTEFLADQEGIVLSREAVRRLRRGAGQGPKRRRRAPHHPRRHGHPSHCRDPWCPPGRRTPIPPPWAGGTRSLRAGDQPRAPVP